MHNLLRLRLPANNTDKVRRLTKSNHCLFIPISTSDLVNHDDYLKKNKAQKVIIYVYVYTVLYYKRKWTKY